MTLAVLIIACLELGQQDCRWDISFPRLKETTSSWRGTWDQGAFLTSTTLWLDNASCDKLNLPSELLLSPVFLCWSRYPRHRKLISINKVNTGSQNHEFNMRHDWNSLLSDRPDLLFKRVNREFYPNADDLPVYLKMFEKELGLRVWYGVDIGQIRAVQLSTGRNYILTDQHALDYTCRYV